MHEVDRWLKPDTLREALKRFRRLGRVVVKQSLSFVDSLPTSSEFARFEEVMPRVADQILSLAENEQFLVSRQSRNLTTQDGIAPTPRQRARGLDCGRRTSRVDVLSGPFMAGAAGTGRGRGTLRRPCELDTGSACNAPRPGSGRLGNHR